MTRIWASDGLILMVLKGLDEEGLHTRACMVKSDSLAAGKSLADLRLRNEFNITVLTVNSEGKNIGNPSGDYVLKPGDRIVMMGDASKFAEAGVLFRDSSNPDELAAT